MNAFLPVVPYFAGLDTTTLIVSGFAGTVFSGIITAFVAILTNRSEKTKTAETSVESTLRERITLRDERIADRDERIQELEEEADERESKLARVEAQLALTLIENERLKANGTH